jgi:hypothetical protein
MNWVWFVNGIQYCCFEHHNLNVAKQRLKAAKRLLNTEQSEVLEFHIAAIEDRTK